MAEPTRGAAPSAPVVGVGLAAAVLAAVAGHQPWAQRHAPPAASASCPRPSRPAGCRPPARWRWWCSPAGACCWSPGAGSAGSSRCSASLAALGLVVDGRGRLRQRTRPGPRRLRTSSASTDPDVEPHRLVLGGRRSRPLLTLLTTAGRRTPGARLARDGPPVRRARPSRGAGAAAAVRRRSRRTSTSGRRWTRVATRRPDRATPRLPGMSAHHGNTPAAWTAVVVALVGFTVGGVGLMLDPVSYPIFWVGVGDHRRRGRGLRGDGPARHGRPRVSAPTVTALAAPPAPPATRGAPDARARGSPSAASRLATLALHLRDPHQHGSWGLCPSAALGSTAPAAAACAPSTT